MMNKAIINEKIPNGELIPLGWEMKVINGNMMPAVIVPSPTYPVIIRTISQIITQINKLMGDNAINIPIIVPAPFPPLNLKNNG